MDEARVRSLIRQAEGITKILRGTEYHQPVADYFTSLPPEVQVEVEDRLRELRGEVTDFLAGR